jgi:immunity protein 10 of polymorphic toxin system
MPDRFTARFVYVGEENGVSMVGVADDRQETVRSVLFQRAQNPDPQDVALGHDQVHWSIDVDGDSGYGGIVSVVLEGSNLVTTWSPGAAGDAGISRCIVVELLVPPAELERLCGGLQQMMPEIFKP